MAQSKSTKKFEKKHLKDTLERRKGLKQTKQKQQLKARKKARRAEENGRDANGDEEHKSSSASQKQKDKEAFQSMSVDDFFQGGFEVPEMPKKKSSKRKRKTDGDEENSESEAASEPEVFPDNADSDSDSDEGNLEDFKEQLNALAEKDPEFHKMLRQDEPEVFDDLEDLQLSEDEEEEPKRKKQRKSQGDDEESDEEGGGAGKNELEMATLKRWGTLMAEQHSLRAAKEVVLAFRAAVQVSTSDAEEKDFKYSVSDPDVYHELLLTALKQIPMVFAHHLPVKEGKSGKAHVPTD